MAPGGGWSIHLKRRRMDLDRPEAATRPSIENEPWPDDTNAGVVPPELVDMLPANFSFDRERYQLDWEHWILPGGMPVGTRPDGHFYHHPGPCARARSDGPDPHQCEVRTGRDLHVHLRDAVEETTPGSSHVIGVPAMTWRYGRKTVSSGLNRSHVTPSTRVRCTNCELVGVELLDRPETPYLHI